MRSSYPEAGKAERASALRPGARRFPVLICGAGPTGLVLALSLARRGVPFRIIDDDAGPGPHSRAVVVHARTLEIYRQFAIADDVINEGVRMDRARLRQATHGHSQELMAFHFGDFGSGISAFPFALAYPQDHHEHLLVRTLDQLGVSVEWNTKLIHYAQRDDRVEVTLLHDDRSQELSEALFLCGCDGIHSVVRSGLSVGFEGGTYPQLYFVADVSLRSGYQTDLILNLGRDTFTLLLPVGLTKLQRLIGLVPAKFSATENLQFAQIQAWQEELIGEEVESVNWFSTYRVHHRVADHFVQGRAFLLGDAGHVHSPAGGQGMNTGVGDAVNLGWKLAMVLNGNAPPTLLDSYESERIGFARALVRTTDSAFTNIVRGGLPGEITRRALLPLLFGLGTATEAGRRAMFRLVSQVNIKYKGSALSAGRAGSVRGGDRLPWFSLNGTDNYEPLSSLDWQLHVYGEATTRLRNICDEHSLDIQVMPWNGAADKAGIKRDAGYLVRPDTYVAVAFDSGRESALQDYLHTRGFKKRVRSAQ